MFQQGMEGKRPKTSVSLTSSPAQRKILYVYY